MKKIAVIGAGIAGLAFADAVRGRAEVSVFEKARGPGGRMSTRSAGGFEFDHGAQFFTARGDAFQKAILAHAASIAEWETEVHNRPVLVGAPKMNALCKFLIDSSGNGARTGALNVRYGHRLERMSRRPEGWMLATSAGAFGPFDLVVSSAPAPQTAQLFGGAWQHQDTVSRVIMLPCFALMLGFGAQLTLPYAAFRPPRADIGWVAVNSSKPGRVSGGTSLVIHSTAEWARDHLEMEAAELVPVLRDLAQPFVPADLAKASFAAAHKWRYANVLRPAGQGSLYDAEAGLAAIGDWCPDDPHGARVESAFDSAMDLAGRVYP